MRKFLFFAAIFSWLAVFVLLFARANPDASKTNREAVPLCQLNIEKPPETLLHPSFPDSAAPVSRGGETRPRVLAVEATAYTKDDPGMDGRGITFTGTRARRGVAAVDPEVIPLGSVLFVPGYGYAQAEDTGGAIKGYRIDLFFENREEALRWGRRKVEVQVFR
jgi:3D (Asp-Asp-Asp) domain-containing protein